MEISDSDDLALGERWKELARRMKMKLSGWTFDQSATFYTTDGTATVEVRGNPSSPMLPHLEKAWGVIGD